MKDYKYYIKLKKANATFIEKRIEEVESEIKSKLNGTTLSKLFIDVNLARDISLLLADLVALKECVLVMKTPVYKAYEEEGKQGSFDSFLER